jgi:hydrogenase expression/formation protein HypE
MNGKRILLSHGSGGLLTRRLIEELFVEEFKNPLLDRLNDQAVFEIPCAGRGGPISERLAFTTDSYVITPLFFPGGDIGCLAVCGTVNDLAVGGAVPKYLSASFIIEEGMEIAELKRIVISMATAAKEAGVEIVTGDTKVVERGKGDRLYINTAGIGVVGAGVELDPTRIEPGDVIILSGTVGDHAIAVLTEREGIELESAVESDCAPLHLMIAKMLEAGGGNGIRTMRDATRGGVATVLAEFAEVSKTSLLIREESVPVKESVRGACELLGFDPLYLANEGKLVAVVSKENADAVLAAMKDDPNGTDAAIIGLVEGEPKDTTEKATGKVVLETIIGNRRPLEMLTGEQLPRIC